MTTTTPDPQTILAAECAALELTGHVRVGDRWAAPWQLPALLSREQAIGYQRIEAARPPRPPRAASLPA